MEQEYHLYYKGYLIDHKNYLITEEIRLLETLSWMLEHKSTIRKTGELFGYPCTTLWRKIHQECPDISCGLYDHLLILLDENKRKGGRRKG